MAKRKVKDTMEDFVSSPERVSPVTIEYCTSGFLGFTGAGGMIKFSEETGKDNYVDYIVESMNYLKDMFCDKGVDFSVMYNAQYEQKDGYMMEMLRNKGMKLEIMSDSGGLQVLTRGLDLEKEKPGIFVSQGTYSDLAMSFDEMPILLVGDQGYQSSHFGNKKATNKYYVKELAYIKGKESSKNVVEQIEEFRKQGTKTKVLLILQGHLLEDYDEYARGVYELIPEEYYDSIHGISMGATAFQQYDDLVDVYMRLQRDLKHVPKQHLKQVHLLGSGTIDRIFPLLIMAKKNYYDFPFKFSIDASTHASASTWGKWTQLHESGRIQTHTIGGYTINKLSIKHLKHMYEELGDMMKHNFKGADTFEDFVENFTPFNKDGKRLKADMEDHTEYVNKSMMYSYNTFLLESSTFLKILNMIVNDRNFNNNTSNKYRRLGSTLLDHMTSYEDYLLHEKELRKVFKHIRPRKINYVNTMADIDALNKITDENIHPMNEWE